jgi:hypothetical protein
MVTAAMIGLDAAIEQPRVCSTFTTRDPMLPESFRNAQDYIRKLVRAELGPHVRSWSILEFTTGKARTSGGIRRPHLHTLWKGVDGDAAPVIAGCAGHVLEKASGSWRHQVDEIVTPAGAMMYVARHHLKESQAPPASWGPTRRVRPSKGYYSAPAEQLRTEAKVIVREKRIRKLLEAENRDRYVDDRGIPMPEDVLWELVIEPALAEALAAPPARPVRICKPWEDPLAA